MRVHRAASEHHQSSPNRQDDLSQKTELLVLEHPERGAKAIAFGEHSLEGKAMV